MQRSAGDLGRLSAAVARAEQQAVTGLKVQRPSDAPGDVPQILRLSAAAADQGVFQANAGRGLDLLTAMDDALGQAVDLITRARELALAGASETYGAPERLALSLEVDMVRDQLLATANLSFGGRYLFAGDAYDAPAFDAAGAYLGATEGPQVQIGPDQWLSVGLDGSAVFQGGLDLFGMLSDLSSALSADDVAGVTAALADMEPATQQLVRTRAQVGVWEGFAEDATSVSQSLDVVLSSRQAALTEVDPVDAYAQLAELRGAYSGALQVMGTSTSRTLFDFLG